MRSVAEADGMRNCDVCPACVLSPPRKKISLKKKYTFVLSVAFKVYDMDRDGFISNGELFLVLKMMVGNNLKVGSRPITLSLAEPLRNGSVDPCRIRNYKKSWTRRSWRRIRTAMGN